VVGRAGSSGSGRRGGFLFSSLILSPLFFSLAGSIESYSLAEDTPGVPADGQILGQHQLALEGMTQMLNKMEFDEGVIAKGLTELGEARH